MLYFQLKGYFVKIFKILDSMCISFSGGILMVPQKHREASKFIYNFGFYITTNVYPGFGEGLVGQAIKKRLKVFKTKSVKHKDTSMTGNKAIKKRLKVFKTKSVKHKDTSMTGKLRFFMINQ